MMNVLKCSPVFLAIPPNNLLSNSNKKNFISMEKTNHWTSISLGGKTHDFSSVVVAASKGQGSSSKKKGGAKMVRLVSEAETGFFYVTHKPRLKAIPKESRNKKIKSENLVLKKYDPRVNRHVWFREAKMK